jgi:putative tryptophan/tyrosine transport system substrate-binding protein
MPHPRVGQRGRLRRRRSSPSVRRIGVLASGDGSDPGSNLRYAAFTQALADLGWTDGRNVRVDLRWYGDGTDRIRVLAQELVGLQPDIILTTGTAANIAVQQEPRTPIVFGDPLASGLVARLDRPSGDLTGFAIYEASLGGKWLELLSEIAPGSSGTGSKAAIGAKSATLRKNHREAPIFIFL